MKNKFVAALVVFATLAGFMSLSAASFAQQADSEEYNKSTPWGDPDLQGNWSYASLTPLQRPQRLGEKMFYTPEEAEEIFARTQLEPTDRPGDVGSYNVEWFDRGAVSLDLRTSLIVDPPNGRLPIREETVQRQAAQAAYTREHPADSWLDRTNWDRCITYHGVPPISSGYNNTYKIVQNPDYVAIVVEMIHDVRIIPLDGRPRLDGRIRQWNGDSRGHWEGDTLVVETTNFSDKTRHRFPSSSNTRAIERFTRVSDVLINYSFTIEDPDVYTSSWTAIRPMPALEDYDLYEYACHEGNYAMTYILRGARIEEMEAGEASENN
ncbi:MAG: hypothetical protein CMQ17_05635 [Gammaproteobacteria bacterium]|jgi:hypothetical protein|nr:hypothetical protein [Gammaproteobacteria bacterium]HJO10708.1 hypothetical protein [Gammaproteobacteria bacterium]|tara:strand:+ start:1412 stop:2380 length:969 start_codon:yes stop_codon:yes gene_type:complete